MKRIGYQTLAVFATLGLWFTRRLPGAEQLVPPAEDAPATA